ncbi:DNA-directed DNA polymerase [Senna tora]|uniref:DNA-directed DNA polymerase n=1 Tax=Senna tora TaxID=362788 RepID=A0A834TK47_9FABA|nr:DNA-directed DNA polymerase [Senna tora]
MTSLCLCILTMRVSLGEVQRLIEKMPTSWVTKMASDRNVDARVAGVQDCDMFLSLYSQIAALTKEVKSLGIQRAVQTVSPFVQPCEDCGESHTSEQCHLVLESVQYLANRNESVPPLDLLQERSTLLPE